MANEVIFEGKERRMAKIEKCLAEYGIASLEDAKALCESKGIDVEGIVKGVQPIAFDNAVWAYTLGVALALKSGVKTASEAAATIGKGLQAFCIPGSVAEQRNVGLGHGNLGAMLLKEETKRGLSLVYMFCKNSPRCTCLMPSIELPLVHSSRLTTYFG